MTRSLLLSAAILTALAVVPSAAADAKKEPMKTLNLRTSLDEGKDRQVEVLFEGPRRKIVQITLRNGSILESHSAPEPITIQCVAGSGTLVAGEEKAELELAPGVLVTLEPGVIHEVRSSPAVSILLSKFGEK